VWLAACDRADLDVSLSGKILLCRSSSTNRYDGLVEQSLENEIGGLLLIRKDQGPYPRSGYGIGKLTAIPAFQISEAIAQDLLAGAQYTLDDLDQLSVPTPLSATVHMAASFASHEIEARNVLGMLPGTDPLLKVEIIVIGAHYDHVGRDPDGTIYNGANDNATGVAVVLEIARLWQAQGFRPGRSVLFAAWDDEEQGLLGSRYYVRHPVYALDRTVAMLNLDMVGVGEKLYIAGRGAMAVQLQASARACRIAAILAPEAEAGGSDDTPFLDAGITAGSPIMSTDSAVELAYHRPEDDAQHVQPGNLRTVGILATHVLAVWSGGPALPPPDP
jgi:Zn-dependent M28 family amino/carboxypeptidase